MISEPVQQAYVWIWLPDATEPVVAGKLQAEGDQLLFNYGRSYLERGDAIAVYDRELPLKRGMHYPLDGLSVPGCIRDAAPDAWGRRVIINRHFGRSGVNLDSADLSELTYLLESGSDRIGALDFQRSATVYEPRLANKVILEELLDSADRVERGVPLTPELDRALLHGSSIGGARPKALIEDDERKFIAKFSSTTDLYQVVKAEFIAMRLAQLAGLDVAPVSLVKVANRDVLLVERFDRQLHSGGWSRSALVSALTLFELDELTARYASYETLAEIIRRRFTEPKATLRELFSRLVFNVLSGNTDDHARNHAAYWNGETLTLTPAYDICPQGRTGNEASQAMLITGNNNLSQLRTCLAAAHHFLLSQAEAEAICDHLIHTIEQQWDGVCDQAELSRVDRQRLWQRQFLNPFSLER